MPIYEYQCQSCHARSEMMQKINDAPTCECPQCHEKTLVRLVSAPRFQLKGTGWYETDFKHNDQAQAKAATEKTPDKSKDKPTTTDKKTTGEKKRKQ